jgi:AraC family transcriptional regulator, arabinose operon regulatory protein
VGYGRNSIQGVSRAFAGRKRSGQIKTPSIETRHDRRIQKIVETLELTPPVVSVRGLARALNLSTSRLAHLFKAETGGPISQRLLDSRLRKAAHLLEATELRIKEITYVVGYGHPSSFARAFRRRFAVSPREYRHRSSKC